MVTLRCSQYCSKTQRNSVGARYCTVGPAWLLKAIRVGTVGWGKLNKRLMQRRQAAALTEICTIPAGHHTGGADDARLGARAANDVAKPVPPLAGPPHQLKLTDRVIVGRAGIQLDPRQHRRVFQVMQVGRLL